MSYTERFTCDVCGAEKKDANHWFLSFRDGDILGFSPWVRAGAVDDQFISQHLCGESCAAVQLTRYLAQRKEGTQP